MRDQPPVVLLGARVVSEDRTYPEGFVRIADGRIVEVGPADTCGDTEGCEVVRLSEEYVIVPGMVDVHIHGAEDADTMDAEPEALETIAGALAREGTTSFLATTITQSPEAIEAALINAARYIESGQSPGRSECLGIHLEGPFISPKRAGAQPLQYIMEPNLEQFKKWQQQAGGWIKLVTLAPEEPGGMELVEYLRDTDVIPSVGHSDATYHTVDQAIKAGCSHVTHLFNGMRGLHHREPGVAGAAFLRKELQVEVIADGIHICPEMLKLAYQQIQSDRLLLITDSMRAKCLQEGVYDLGGQRVQVNGEEARLSDGTLAGSILRMADAFQRMYGIAGGSLENLVRMSSMNAASELRVSDRKGSIREGKDADVVVLDKQLEVAMTYCRGVLAYRRKSAYSKKEVTDADPTSP
ncbi:N-acetylglucosamine-6-phosphate deacetylase [Paludifilum halophilum]|uniref:N-acetylglucosamine-6-phosphate deacetylase n=1 Tax=Paludifilum halophilum TaxID=1642702 RepID=A0A235B742_9BACL|nr:N-acetylglucosamine-6-phosphate deacetylase [Paludifilum halophilum]OYD07697.1 N-acetylglucosamine-6-phosphate deacetylase [Paludifilum halophilum]